MQRPLLLPLSQTHKSGQPRGCVLIDVYLHTENTLDQVKLRQVVLSPLLQVCLSGVATPLDHCKFSVDENKQRRKKKIKHGGSLQRRFIAQAGLHWTGHWTKQTTAAVYLSLVCKGRGKECAYL